MYRVTRLIQKNISPENFICKNNVFFRINEDIVQGFTIKRKYYPKGPVYTINFTIYPLCYPDALFYNFEFEGQDIGFLMSPIRYWPFDAISGFSFQYEEYVQEILQALRIYLFPYFEKYHNCTSISDGITDVNGINDLSLEAAYYHLRAGKRDAAIWGIRNLQNLRKEADEQNARDGIFPANPSSRAAIDEKLRNLYDFFSFAPEQEIQEYILANERRATEFLQKNSNS